MGAAVFSGAGFAAVFSLAAFASVAYACCSAAGCFTAVGASFFCSINLFSSFLALAVVVSFVLAWDNSFFSAAVDCFASSFYLLHSRRLESVRSSEQFLV